MLKKRLTLMLCAVIVAAAMLVSCAPAQDGSPRTSAEMAVIAEIDGKSIYMYELYDWIKLAGLSEDIIEQPEIQKEVLDYFVESMLTEHVIGIKGYYDNLGEEDLAMAGDYAEYYIQNGMSGGKTEEQVLEEIGMTKEELIGKYKFKIAENNAYVELTGDAEATEDELKSEYELSVDSQKQQMDADPGVYVQSANDEVTIYYVPAGVRMVRRILIPFDENTAGAIGMLRGSGYDDQAVVVREDGLKDIQIKADDIMARLVSGKSFGDVVEELKEDEKVSVEEYPVAKGTQVYSEEFTQAAMELVSIGDVSELVVTDEGYQIIEYASDVKQGAVSFDSVKDTISANIKPNKQNEAWEEAIKQWRQDYKVVCYYENLPQAAEEEAEVTESPKAS